MSNPETAMSAFDPNRDYVSMYPQPAAPTPTPPTENFGIFSPKNLKVLAYVNGFTQWHYKCGVNELSAVTVPGFFDLGSDMLNPGDHIIASGPDGGKMFFIRFRKIGHGVQLFAEAS